MDTGLGSDLDSPSAVRGRLGVDMGPGSGVTAFGRAGEGSGRLRRGGRGGVRSSAAPRGSAARGALRAPPEAHPGRGELGSGRGRGAPGESSWGAAGGRWPYLLGDRGAVRDEQERGEQVDGEAQEGDGVGGHPQRDPLEQPGPVELQRRLKQRDARGCVAVFLQPPQLRRVQRLRQRLQPARRRPDPGARRHGRLRAPPLRASTARAGRPGGDRWREGLAGPDLRRPGGTRRSGPRPRSRSGRAAPGPGAPAPRAAGGGGRGLGEGSGREGRGRGRGRGGGGGRLRPARCQGRWDRPALATGSPRWLRRLSLSNWRAKGPDFPKSLMHLPLRPDPSPGTAGDAPQREVSTAGQLEAGCSNSCGVHSSDLLVCERPGL